MRFAVFVADGQGVRQVLLEAAHRIRVEVAAAIVDDMGHRVFDLPRPLVGAARAQRVKDVGNGDDAPSLRDARAGEAGRIAAAVPLLVVRA